MGKFVVKKRVSLEFLGEDYKDGYLVFRSIPTRDYEDLMVKVKEKEDKQEESIGLLVDVICNYFLEGKFPVDGKLEDLTKEDVSEIDKETTIKCFQILTGQDLSEDTPDPKDEKPSSQASTT